MIRFELFEGGEAVTLDPLAVDSIEETRRGGDAVAVISIAGNEFVVPDPDRTVARQIAEAKQAILAGE